MSNHHRFTAGRRPRIRLRSLAGIVRATAVVATAAPAVNADAAVLANSAPARLTSRLRAKRRRAMFSIGRSMRGAIVVLVATAAFGLTATSAFALTASQKQANFHSCLDLGGTWQSCCIGSGGTYNHFQYPFTGQWLETCAWSSDSQTQPIGSSPVAGNVLGGGTPPPAA